MNNINQQISAIQAQYSAHANEATALQAHHYVKGKFLFYGIKAPERRALDKECWAEVGLPKYEELAEMVKILWAEPQRELHYFALENIGKLKKYWKEDLIDLLEYVILHHSWWDSVDFAAKWVGEFFQKFPHLIVPVTEKWMASGNMWLQRVCIIFQLTYKKQTNTQLMFDYMLLCADSKEFFLQKAIGWALRQYSRTDPQAVIEFVANHTLKPLSKKEALRLLAK